MLPSQAGNGAAALPRSSVMGMARTSSGRPGAGIPRGANGGGAGVRGPGNGTGPPSGQGPVGSRLERERDRDVAAAASAVGSGSEGESDSAEDEELGGDRRGMKRTLGEMELVGHEAAVAAAAAAAAAAAGGYGGVSGAVSGAKPGKKTRGRVKIKMEFIDNKLRRYTTFSKRKTGIMKKAYELSTLTGTQVLLLVASETGHVYTFATRKLQPMITSETGKALIQTCLNSPDSPPRSDPTTDQRMSATGFEETDLTYQVSESDSSGETKDSLKPAFTVTNLPGTTSTIQTAPTTSTSMQVSSGPSFPITNYLAPVSASVSPNTVTSANGTVLKTTGTSAVASGGLMQIPTGFTLMSGAPLPPGTPTIPLTQLQPHSLALSSQQGQVAVAGTPGQLQQAQQTVFRFPASAGGQFVSLTAESLGEYCMNLISGGVRGGAVAQQVPVQAIQVHQAPQQTSPTTDSSTDLTQTSSSGTVTLPATIMTSSVPTTVGGHMMYPSPHTVMYAPTSGLTDGGLAVLNAFSQAPSAMQVSHGQVQDQGGVSQVFLTAPSGTVQIPVSAVQLHQMAVIGQQSSSSTNLTELQVVNLDTSHSSKSD
ncbi:serum response factor isoform X2 [Hemicordylus capensis]|uniref:serum response factor isoform X2 n=1 Tax=Hemicordylus capensis TaxID=884348 RepID=UPI002303CD10|nr:serum response factor isoform X2 [Hemicordylus capensis]